MEWLEVGGLEIKLIGQTSSRGAELLRVVIDWYGDILKMLRC